MGHRPFAITPFSLAILLTGCATLPAVPALPPPPVSRAQPLPEENPPPQLLASPREKHAREEQALVWFYPLISVPQGSPLLAEKTAFAAHQAGYRWLAPPSGLTALPAPNQTKGGKSLARAGVGYVVVPHYETGPAGFLTLELYRPPSPDLAWVTSVPLTATEDIATALDQALGLLVKHLSRQVKQVAIAQLEAPGEVKLVHEATLPRSGTRYEVQTGAFLVAENALDAMEKLRQDGYQPYEVEVTDQMERLWHVVRIGRYPTRERAEAQKEEFEKKEKLSGYIAFTGRF